MTAALEPARPRRCAVYTRKSTDEGLDRDFNSLDAQREAGLAYIASQKAMGWLPVPDRYDDGGYSGGTMERPALQRLLHDIEAGRVDIVVVYKIDRLSRSLKDFVKLVERLERHHVTFVSVTQAFNTTDSMGRLMLNILLSFAQFERENSSERVRDKIAASRRRGMFMGGFVPLGYDLKDRHLLVNPAEAKIVRFIFERFAVLGAGTTLCDELNAQGHTTKLVIERSGKRRGCRPFDRMAIYKILHNRTYLGEAVHKGTSYPGKHQAIIDRPLWDRVHAILKTNARFRANVTRSKVPALLRGLIFAASGRAMTHAYARSRGRLYRYYVSGDVIKRGPTGSPVDRIGAGEIEAAVVDRIRALLRSPEIVVQTWLAAKAHDAALDEHEVRDALYRLDPLWNELFPAEQARIVKHLVERIDVHPDRLTIRLRLDGLADIAGDLRHGMRRAPAGNGEKPAPPP